ncbi:hypothetical protein AC790_08835 [Pantoea sp. RIT-PI-b]|nr:hypothetical protein AC790_08835 [Pantoea sp. RIT-PI-b]
MLRVEYNYNEGKYYFLYVTDEVRISTDNPDSLNLECRDGSTVKIHYVWTYLEPTKDAFFALSLLTQHTDEVVNAVQILKACGACYED